MSDGIRDSQYVSGECEPAIDKKTKSYSLAEMKAEQGALCFQRDECQKKIMELQTKIREEENKIHNLAKNLKDQEIEQIIYRTLIVEDETKQALIYAAKMGRDYYSGNY